jgi:mannose-1-phosphate guanylyltransferase
LATPFDRSSDVHAIVFAGGAGQRLWPLSRRNSPKQFTPLIGSKSSIQLAVERLGRIVNPERTYVGTNRAYADLLRAQLPAVPERNYILEPARRDVAAAVALAFFTLEKDGIVGPVVFQWSDHYVKEGDRLLTLLTAGREMVESGRAGMVIVAQEPDSANDNLGWLKVEGSRGRAHGHDYYSFGEWSYRPSRERCLQMFESREWVWNTGHFVTSVEFMTSSFRSRAPALAAAIEEIVSFRDTPDESSALERLYPRLEPNNFDDVILKQIPRDRAFLLKADLGWVDPGNLNSLKGVLQKAVDDTVTRGNVIELRTKNSFVYNGTDRPVAVMGVSNVIVVEMPDVTLVVDRDSVRDLGVLLKELESRGLTSLL